jgi:hypothetical protein
MTNDEDIKTEITTMLAEMIEQGLIERTPQGVRITELGKRTRKLASAEDRVILQ